ncbi:MAG: hypothetical protein WCA84_15830, partial [Ignavibacteriaceae bacterium]
NGQCLLEIGPLLFLIFQLCLNKGLRLSYEFNLSFTQIILQTLIKLKKPGYAGLFYNHPDSWAILA